MFILEGRLPGLNEYIAAMNKSRWAGADMKRKWTNKVRDAAIEAHEPKHSGRVIVKVRWVEKNRRRDKDNIRFGMKFVLDGLVKAGVIPNDSWDYVEKPDDEYAVDPDFPRVEVYVKEVSE